jgi:hypothetical protein
VAAFHQGVRDEKMMEKLATHDIKDVTELFSLADKCARAMEGQAWHALLAQRWKKMASPMPALLPREAAARTRTTRRRRSATTISR